VEAALKNRHSRFVIMADWLAYGLEDAYGEQPEIGH
jgi:hypothetical protein